MVRGTLEVLLVSAKGLEDVDFFGKMDPYAVLMYRSQEQKSSTASGAGSDPEWHETFVFNNVSDNVSELIVKIMDSDTFSKDDFVGEAKIPLEAVFAEGSLPPTIYSVVKDQRYCGEIKVGLTFTPVETRGFDEEAFGDGNIPRIRKCHLKEEVCARVKSIKLDYIVSERTEWP